MVARGILDVDRALEAVREFTSILTDSQAAYVRQESPFGFLGSGPQEYCTLETSIRELCHLVEGIAGRVDQGLLGQLRFRDQDGWPYQTALVACETLIGRLKFMEVEEEILGPEGPVLAAQDLHEWIWNPAVDLWNDGHFKHGVSAAAGALFDHQIPAKLGVSRAKSAKDQVTSAFSTDAPKPDSPRLRLPDVEEGSPEWISIHEGAMHLGQGCAQLVRNVSVHGDQEMTESEALERMATLSILARLIERAEVWRAEVNFQTREAG